MLEKPNLADTAVIACLHERYGLHIKDLTFLPLGADSNTVVYRANATDTIPYFVKLRRDDFTPASVAVPKFLSDSGLQQVIPPLPTQTGQLWATVADYKLILYPYVAGGNGFEVALSDTQRILFGTTLKRFHTTRFPKTITNGIPHDTFSPQWCQQLDAILTQAASQPAPQADDLLASDLVAFLREQTALMQHLLARTTVLAARLQANPPDFILCHADMHGWNMLISEDKAFYIVDWDTLVFAPKERDLMFVGCGLGGSGHSLADEQRLFYAGYGQTAVNQTALAYYRYNRIIEDVVEFCNHIFGSSGNGPDRQWALRTLKVNFAPNNTIDLAQQLDQAN